MSYKAALWRRGPEKSMRGCVAWVDPSRGVTLSATLRVRSTSTPPTISSASSLTQCLPVWGIVRTPGAVAVAAVDASSNSGAYRSVRQASTAPGAIALPDTDCTLNFTGTLAVNDVFQTCVASVADVVGARVFTSVNQAGSPPLEVRGCAGTGNQNIFQRNCYGAGLRNLPTFQAETCLMLNVASIAPLFLVTGGSWTIIISARVTGNLASGNFGAFVGAGANSTTDSTSRMAFGHDGAGHLQFDIRSSGAGTPISTITQTSGPAVNHSDFTAVIRYDNATGKFSLFRNGVKVATDVTATNGTLGALSLDVLCLLGRRRRNLLTPIDDLKVNGCLHDAGFSNVALTDQEISDLSMLVQGGQGIIEPVTNGLVVGVGDSNMAGATSTNWFPQMKWGIDALGTGSGETPSLANFASAGNAMIGDPDNPADNTGALGGFQLAQLAAAFVPGAILINGCGEANIHTDGSGNVNVLTANTTTWRSRVIAMGYDPARIIFIIFPYATPNPGDPIAPDFLAKQEIYAAFLKTIADPRLIVDFRNIPGAPNDNNYWADQQHLASNGSIRGGNLVLSAYQFAAHGA